MIYIFWQVVTLGVVNQSQLLENQGLSSLISTLATTVHRSNLAQTIGIFADLALLTSFLGVSLGLFEFLGDKINKSGNGGSRVLVGLVTFLPPMGFALFYPQGFIAALGYAAIALVVLAIFLPILMVKQARQQASTQSYQVLGGNLGLIVTSSVGVIIVTAQVLITAGVLPSLG